MKCKVLCTFTTKTAYKWGTKCSMFICMKSLCVQSGYSTSYGVQSGDSSHNLNKDM